MPIVNFNIPESLARRIDMALQNRGYISRAEFFRMAAIFALENDRELSLEEKERYLVKAIKEEVKNRYRGKQVSLSSNKLV